ncbi:unnamed protein product [Dovyalis caffra]|uniref:Cytochrome P450 n=1 Tax=Dovyalis caffra TaxID=77055 RepID=A0AAV1RAE5_9ROSI|nr:unnamed protein product [Dovyalis caffra]
MKKLCVTELLGPRQLERSSGVRSQEILRFMNKLLEKASQNEVVDLGAELAKLTNNVTCRMVMSTTCSEEDGEAEKCRELVKESFELAAKLCFGEVLGPLKSLGFWLYGKQAMNLTNRYDELFERILKEHENSGSREAWKNEQVDLVDVLLHVYQDEKVEVKITKTQIKAFLLELDNMDRDQCESTVQNFGFVPFGGGRKGCPGTMVAYNLIYTVIAAMVQCFDWEVKGQVAEAKVNVEAGSGMSMGMAHPLLCLLVVYFNPLTAKR